MDIGLSTILTEYSIDITVLALRAEELGFESLWAAEHTIIPLTATTRRPGVPLDTGIPEDYAHIVDPFVALARASAVTTTLKLGTGVCLLPERNPLLVAKQVATSDMYSGGRVLFGVGAGWLKEETEIMGGDFEHRWTQTREAVLAMKELWAAEEGEFHGRYYDFPAVYSFPKPVQRPHPPVLLAGASANVFKRVIAWGDGWVTDIITPEQVKDGRATLNRLARETGRDPTAIRVTVYGQPHDVDLIRRFEDAGADSVNILLPPASEGESLAQIEGIAESLIVRA